MVFDKKKWTRENRKKLEVKKRLRENQRKYRKKHKPWREEKNKEYMEKYKQNGEIKWQ